MDQDPKLLGVLRGPTGGRGQFLRDARRYLLGGILVTAPIGFTLYLAWALVRFFDRQVMPLIPPALDPARLLPESLEPYGIPGIGLVVTVFGLIAVGWLASRAVGRYFVRAGERLVGAVPVVRGVHGTFKQIIETVLSDQDAAFREVVLFEYPRAGTWALGFVSGETRGQVQQLTDETVLNIFLPTTPNPTSGYLLFVPRRDVVSLDMTVEEGMRMIISAGIVTPGAIRAVEPSSEKCREANASPGVE